MHLRSGALSPFSAIEKRRISLRMRKIRRFWRRIRTQRTDFHKKGLVWGHKLDTSIYAEIKGWAHPYAVFNKLPKNRARKSIGLKFTPPKRIGQGRSELKSECRYRTKPKSYAPPFRGVEPIFRHWKKADFSAHAQDTTFLMPDSDSAHRFP